MNFPFFVCILGSSSAMPAFGRNTSAQVLSHNSRLFLLDCGEGAQLQFRKYQFRNSRLDAIFISHLHGDHIWGLPGFLTTLSLSNHLEPLVIYGPKGLKNLVEHMIVASQSFIKYPLEIIEIEPSNSFPYIVYENKGLQVSCFPLQHRIECYGFLFQEKPKRARFMYYEAKRDGIPKEYYSLLKNGAALVLQNGLEIAANQYLGEAPPSFSYAYCTDTRYSDSYLPYIQGATVLYHEATFTQEFLVRAEETAHSTAQEAALAAKTAGVEQLIIGHFSARYRYLDTFLAESQSIFANTELAIEGRMFPIPPPAILPLTEGLEDASNHDRTTPDFE
jgi:ribonuclease Z